MAKRKKSHHHTRASKRRRRVSGITHGLGGDMMEVVGLVAGNIAGTVIQRQLTTISPKLISGGQLVGGYLIKKKMHGNFMQGVGLGLMSAGAIGLTHEFGVIRGVEDFVNGIDDGINGSYLDYDQMHGLSNENSMSGLNNSAMVAGGGGFDRVNEM
jgi:hypothetical protein